MENGTTRGQSAADSPAAEPTVETPSQQADSPLSKGATIPTALRAEPLSKGALSAENAEGEPESPPVEEPETPPDGALSGARLEQLLAYCKLTELAEDPEVAALIPVLYGAAVGYMTNAGVALPEEGTPRRAQYDLCVNYLVLDAYERRETAMVATVVSDNPAFRRLVNQLKLTEPEVGL